jgi:glycine/D-amino acid oxidase-like deaminating enzyme
LSSSTHFDFCVLGAGLAGLAVSKSLIESGASVCLIDVKDIASGASGTPLGLVNPATGRAGTKTWHAEECYDAVYDDLKEVQDSTDVRIFDKTGVLRPAQDEKMASRMHQNVTDQDWPEGWCSWLDSKEVKDTNPDIHCFEGAMWLPHALTVNTGAYLNTKARMLSEKGLTIYTDINYTLSKENDGFKMTISGSEDIHAKNVIHTTGSSTKESSYWDYLPIHPIKGQVAIFESPKTKDFKFSISALGYIASISDTRFVAGSTYEHNYDHLQPDNQGLSYLTNRLSGVYPVLFEEAKLVDQWAGVRASSPNKKPILGRHPEHENLFVFTCLGSKGLLYSAYLGKTLTNFILKGSAIPKEISLNRF